MKNAGHRAGRKHKISAEDLGNAFRRLKRVNDEDEDFMGIYDDDDVAYEDDYEDEVINPYRDGGPDDDPNWGYDNFDTFDDEPRSRKPVPDIERYRNSRANNFVDHMGSNPRDSERNSANMYVENMLARTPEERLERLPNNRGLIRYEDGTRTIGTHNDSDSARWGHENNYTDPDEEQYLDYLEQYDRGEISNYEMSQIQHEFANKAFWDTFSPSENLIEQYGSGNRSTRWPMFERRGGRWRPIFWRND